MKWEHITWLLIALFQVYIFSSHKTKYNPSQKDVLHNSWNIKYNILIGNYPTKLCGKAVWGRLFNTADTTSIASTAVDKEKEVNVELFEKHKYNLKNWNQRGAS